MTVSANKRLKERARQDKQRDKGAKRQERRATQGTGPAVAPGEDPDLVGIVPGPQPVVEDD